MTSPEATRAAGIKTVEGLCYPRNLYLRDTELKVNNNAYRLHKTTKILFIAIVYF